MVASYFIISYIRNAFTFKSYNSFWLCTSFNSISFFTIKSSYFYFTTKSSLNKVYFYITVNIISLSFKYSMWLYIYCYKKVTVFSAKFSSITFTSKTNCLTIINTLRGFEPSSKRGTNELSTCLSSL